MSGRAGTARGAPRGQGFAIIAFHGSSVVCWRFAHLHGFTEATGAKVVAGKRGHAGAPVISLSRGSRLHHQGCVRVGAVMSKEIWNDPGGYFVSVMSMGYPQGAVRAQL